MMEEDKSNEDFTTTLNSEESVEDIENKPFYFQKNCSSNHHFISDSDEDEDLFTPPISKRSKLEPNSSSTSSGILDVTKSKPACPYGAACYRKNVKHLNDFLHSTSRDKDENNCTTSSLTDVSDSMVPWSNCFGVYINRVQGLKQGSVPQITISEILSKDMGILKSSVQFNFMFEIQWLRNQYPSEFRNLPLLLVHGEQGAAKSGIDMEAAHFSNITTCQARLDMPYGTHHTKMMLLQYEDGLRIVIMTANLVERDWNKKTQGIWISDKLPPLSTNLQSRTDHDNEEKILGDSDTQFKRDFLLYLSCYNHSKIRALMKEIRNYDFSSVKVFLVGSTPGRHMDNRLNEFGHTKVKKILQENRSQLNCDHKWPLIGQFSSIGRLGNDPNQWLLSEWRQSFVIDKHKEKHLESPMSAQVNTKLIFPCVDDVRDSLEGYMSGGSLPYSINTAKNQPWLKNFLHKWIASHSNRTRASPHIKSYVRVDPHLKTLSWFILTSANLSKAAWGAFEKKCSQLMMRSYELGVMFIPHRFGMKEFRIKTCPHLDQSQSRNDFPVPFDIPLTPYDSTDSPWIVDMAYADKPDCLGNYWIPK